MITIGIDPILLSLGSLSVSWHSLFMVVAIVVGVWLPAHLVAKAGLSKDRLYSLALWAIPGGIVGARLVHVIDYWSYYSANPGAIPRLLGGWSGYLGGHPWWNTYRGNIHQN